VDSACLRLVHLLHNRHGDTGGEWLGAFFLAEAWSGTPSVQEPAKHDDLAWFDVQQLPDNLIPYVRQSLLLPRGQVPFSTYGFD
jgi:8-oxo-dGTP diphosphatase